MNNSGQVSVELKLVLDSLRKQAKEAADILRNAVKGESSSPAKETDKAKKSQDSLTESVKKTTNALKDQKKAAYEAWKASLPAPQVYGVPGGAKPPPADWTGYGHTMNPTQGPMPAGGGGGLATNPGYNGPTPPVIPPGGGAGGGGGGGGGGVGAGLAAAVTAISTAFLAAKEAIQMFARAIRFVVDTVMASAEAAKRLYAKSLASGMTVAFSAKRSMLADAIGVSETDVYKYANAIKYLNGRLTLASSIMAQTTPQLTALSYEWAILKADISALTSQISAELSPILIGLIRVFDMLTTMTSELISMMRTVDETKATKVYNLIFHPILEILKMLGKAGGGVSSPDASAKKMPSSSWERMGLVLGNGGKNYAEQTAKNTARIAEYSKQMANKEGNNSKSFELFKNWKEQTNYSSTIQGPIPSLP